MYQALFQYFTCIAWFHSVNKSSLSTNHVQDTSLDISREQNTQTPCFHGNDTRVPQPINRTRSVLAGVSVLEKERAHMDRLSVAHFGGMNTIPILQMRKLGHRGTV